MRSLVAKLVFGAAIVSLTVSASAADNSLGSWKLNMGKSKFSPTAPVKSLSITREASDGGVKVTTKGERADGAAVDASYSAKYDGKENHVTGNSPYDTIAIKQVNGSTLTTTQRKSDGKYHATGRLVVAKDGKTMTTSTRGTNTDGKPFSYTMVWDKQ